MQKCECAGIGRQARLRGVCFDVRVQVPSLAPHARSAEYGWKDGWAGLRRTTGTRVYVNSVPRVRIPLFPPNIFMKSSVISKCIDFMLLFLLSKLSRFLFIRKYYIISCWFTNMYDTEYDTLILTKTATPYRFGKRWLFLVSPKIKFTVPASKLQPHLHGSIPDNRRS